MKCCVDYLETRAEVNRADRHDGALAGRNDDHLHRRREPRIKAADIIGYVNPWDGFGIQRANFCGSQMVPEVIATSTPTTSPG